MILELGIETWEWRNKVFTCAIHTLKNSMKSLELKVWILFQNLWLHNISWVINNLIKGSIPYAKHYRFCDIDSVFALAMT